MKKINLKEMMKIAGDCGTCHCEGVRKHDCGNPEKIIGNPTKQTGLPRSRWSLAMTGKKKAAFTLAETLITLTILGVVAAITVPMLINKQIESANRTKLKKAMAAYEKALNQMIIDNDIKSGPISTIEGFKAADNCSTSTTYFKKINGDGCRFQTADKVYWDISDIEHPLISLKDEITDENIATLKGNADSLDDDKTSFVMVGEIKDGIVRINDKGSMTDTTNSSHLAKLYNFINPDSAVSNVEGSNSCNTLCEIKKMTFSDIGNMPECSETVTTNCLKNVRTNTMMPIQIVYDENGNDTGYAVNGDEYDFKIYKSSPISNSDRYRAYEIQISSISSKGERYISQEVSDDATFNFIGMVESGTITNRTEDSNGNIYVSDTAEYKDGNLVCYKKYDTNNSVISTEGNGCN